MSQHTHWNDRTDKDLLLAILAVKHINTIGRTEWTAIADIMRGRGHMLSNEACRQHFRALKTAVGCGNGAATGQDAPTAASEAPGSAASPVVRRLGGRKRKASEAAGKQRATTEPFLAARDTLHAGLAVPAFTPAKRRRKSAARDPPASTTARFHSVETLPETSSGGFEARPRQPASAALIPGRHAAAANDRSGPI